ncbi:ATP-dependent Lon protease [Bradyrhizobium sp. USDA 3240]
MRDFRDAKPMAQTLREALKAKSISITHSESLELIAKALGSHDWNELSSKIEATRPTLTKSRRLVTATTLFEAAVPILPLRDIVLFPEMVCPIFVGRHKTRRAVDNALDRDGLMFVVAQRRESDDDPNLEALHSVGVAAHITNHWTLVDGTLKVHVSGIERATVKRFISDEFLVAEIAPVKQVRVDVPEATALSRAVLEAYQCYFDVDFSSLRDSEGMLSLAHVGNPGALADSIAPELSIDIDKKQKILEASDVVRRLEMILELMAGGKAA